MTEIMKRLPIELVQIILSYSYNCQPETICADIQSFYTSKAEICDTFYLRYKDILIHEERADMNWLTSDVWKYYHTNHNSYSRIYYDKFYEISSRHFILRDKERTNIVRILRKLFNTPVQTQFHILWGLLLPEERTHFINIQHRILPF